MDGIKHTITLNGLALQAYSITGRLFIENCAFALYAFWSRQSHSNIMGGSLKTFTFLSFPC